MAVKGLKRGDGQLSSFGQAGFLLHSGQSLVKLKLSGELRLGLNAVGDQQVVDDGLAKILPKIEVGIIRRIDMIEDSAIFFEKARDQSGVLDESLSVQMRRANKVYVFFAVIR